ncbi:hypothetical protein NKG94_39015 [Micromonospora sp. M12]
MLREAGLTRTRAAGTSRLVRLRRDELDKLYPGLLDAVLVPAHRRPDARRSPTATLDSGVGLSPAHAMELNRSRHQRTGADPDGRTRNPGPDAGRRTPEAGSRTPEAGSRKPEAGPSDD